MFRIRRIYDDLLPINRSAIEQAQAIIREQFSDMSDAKISELPEKLLNPMKYDFRTILLVCDDRKGRIKGFAQFSVQPRLKFGFLDVIALVENSKGGGLGASLYKRVQEECAGLGLDWLFFECQTDLPCCNEDPTAFKENQARLRFYERLGARPVQNTLYERPRDANAGNSYFLMVDDLDGEGGLDLKSALAAVRVILRRKYRALMSSREINKILASFGDDPVQVRPPKYVRTTPQHVYPRIAQDKKIPLCVTDGHSIHHIKDHGYVELPVRVTSILEELDKTDLFLRIRRKRFSDRHILAVHDRKFVKFFKDLALSIEPEDSLFPDVFPIRKHVGEPKPIRSHVGYYCIDIYSPINRNAYLAAREAVDATLTAASAIEDGDHFAYALVRPPGHHASSDSFGGYCYFNSTAIAAHYLSRHGKVAILDLDYHHGNGQEEIFYKREDVLTVSIHADPNFEYPYFSGYKEDIGEDAGLGCNLNIPLKRGIDGAIYAKALRRACKAIKDFKPRVLVIALGLDTANNDPSGTWGLVADDFAANARHIAKLGFPTLVVQEGGYDCAVLGKNALAFLDGLWTGFYT